jgi:hypothetical protein
MSWKAAMLGGVVLGKFWDVNCMGGITNLSS